MFQSTSRPAKNKSAKPYPEFPLFAHATGRWAKKVRGKFVYFGKVADDPAGVTALKAWLEQREDLYAGRTPRKDHAGLTVHKLCNQYIATKKHLKDTGEITARTFQTYYATCEQLLEVLGHDRPVDDIVVDDFEKLRKVMSKTLGPVALGNEIQRARMVFKYAFDQGLIDRPLRYGQSFKKPSRKTLRKNRAARPPRMFEAAELKKLIKAAGPPLKAMILLGINCGFGQSDISSLNQQAVDLKTGWVDFPRPKTGIPRRVPLWPETIKAIRKAYAQRPRHKSPDDAALIFITKYGQRWVKSNEKGMSIDAVGQEFSKLLTALKCKRPGVCFYALRHTLETIGGESRDQVAVDHIMGHGRDDMASLYRERISDDRLKAVAEHVHQWLFGKKRSKRV